ncbi:hypothetical protein RI129_008210 [Pyrocoelia pectoralis]|uniref:Uncharacterized protein n=1 Tax=Pyrocoelia pectoralis TaxID=417401 RepID=A0AAN7V885_9COLE
MLRSIAKLSKLRKLAIDVPNINDTKCILDICKICANLISLKISSQQDLDVYTCLRYLRMLKDFRYQQAYLPLQAILKSLVSHEAYNLERVVLKCDRTDMFSYDIFEEFLISNPQLKLLYIRISEYSKADLEPISRYLNKFKLKQQIFIITNSDSDCLHLVPVSYMLEMVQFNTSIGVIDIFNSFH